MLLSEQRQNGSTLTLLKTIFRDSIALLDRQLLQTKFSAMGIEHLSRQAFDESRQNQKRWKHRR